MKKQTKRIKAWVNEYEWGAGDSYSTAGAARSVAVNMWLVNAPTRVAVPLVELRRGEVVVDVEALADAVARDLVAVGYDEEDAPTFSESVRRALKKVGVR